MLQECCSQATNQTTIKAVFLCDGLSDGPAEGLYASSGMSVCFVECDFWSCQYVNSFLTIKYFL